MNKLYAVAYFANKITGNQLASRVMAGYSRWSDEKTCHREAMKQWKEQYPESEGWKDHVVSMMEIPQEVIDAHAR